MSIDIQPFQSIIQEEREIIIAISDSQLVQKNDPLAQLRLKVEQLRNQNKELIYKSIESKAYIENLEWQVSQLNNKIKDGHLKMLEIDQQIKDLKKQCISLTHDQLKIRINSIFIYKSSEQGTQKQMEHPINYLQIKQKNIQQVLQDFRNEQNQIKQNNSIRDQYKQSYKQRDNLQNDNQEVIAKFDSNQFYLHQIQNLTNDKIQLQKSIENLHEIYKKELAERGLQEVKQYEQNIKLLRRKQNELQKLLTDNMNIYNQISDFSSQNQKLKSKLNLLEKNHSESIMNAQNNFNSMVQQFNDQIIRLKEQYMLKERTLQEQINNLRQKSLTQQQKFNSQSSKQGLQRLSKNLNFKDICILIQKFSLSLDQKQKTRLHNILLTLIFAKIC